MAAHELGATVGAWNSTVRRARMTDRQKLASLVISSYADPDGTGIHCGVTRLAVDLDTSYRTAQRYLSWLREIGLIELVRGGNRRKRLSDEYRLILGPDVMEHLEVLAPDRYDKARDQLREGRSVRRDQASPKDDAQSAPESACSEGDQASPGLSYKDLDQASNDMRSGVTLDVPPPNRHTSPKRSTSPKTVDEDLRTAVTGPRATGAEMTKPESPSLPKRCPDHGLGGGRRPDGLPECTLCRVALSRTLGPPEPDPAPPPKPRCPYGVPLTGVACRCGPCVLDAKQGIATIIDLDSRRTA